eukprot:CAMPEP_0183296964 /NCGR_PEP_ID=MMETSP0160_2-20130417/4362_1 /TAXON_ID=2839 ORGANISM="Odontella Sinensis, Strain Grunow 1884" /NCGR_SAMPLE_ID=MMETSP0160_2 /ASSEMBLY_ACC=CAM_ASM_000250 /LENGTH=82 /DNA_ID=CAMNT_0025458675 /DNA_START=677 /DNA_END=921 /DNA_ORIENTATION=-
MGAQRTNFTLDEDDEDIDDVPDAADAREELEGMRRMQLPIAGSNSISISSSLLSSSESSAQLKPLVQDLISLIGMTDIFTGV